MNRSNTVNGHRILILLAALLVTAGQTLIIAADSASTAQRAAPQAPDTVRGNAAGRVA